MTPNSNLFRQFAHFLPASSLLVMNCDDHHLIADLSGHAQGISVYHRSASTLERLKQHLADYPTIRVYDAVFPLEEAAVGAALVEVPKGRDISRSTLFLALQAVEPAGFVFAAGANDGGAKTAESDMKSVASVRTMGTKARHRLFSIYRDPNRELALPEDWEIPDEMQTRTFTIHGQDYTVHTQPGVFSWDHLDEGSAFLLDAMQTLDLPKGERVLDAGCGYGIVGMVAQRELEPYQTVWVDDDLLAIQCMQASSPDGEIIAADLTQTSLTGKFDLILCNPPFHREHDKDLGFMRAFAPRASTMLKPTGKLMIVANSFLPYREVLEPRFSQIDKVADNGRFQVLVASV